MESKERACEREARGGRRGWDKKKATVFMWGWGIVSNRACTFIVDDCEDKKKKSTKNKTKPPTLHHGG